MEVPGIRRVRSTHVPRRDRNLGAVRSGHRHDRRAAAGAGQDRRRRARRCPAGHRARRRAADAGGVSDLSLNLTGGLPRRRPATTTRSTSCGRALARVAGVGQRRGARERHARDRGGRSIRRGSPRRADRRRRRRARCRAPTCSRRSGATRPAACSISCSPRGCGNRSTQIGADAGRRSRAARACACGDVGDGRPGRAGPHLAHHRQRPATPPASACRSRSAPTSSTCETGVEQALARARARAARRACTLTKIYDLAEFVARRDRQRARRDPDRRRARRARPARCSCATGG